MSVQTNPVSDGLITISQAALYCGVHRNTIRNWILEGKLPAFRFGSRIVRVNAADVAALASPYQGGAYSVWNRA
jgi:excisionase family DNA binding protein